jgi:hypothetical protein
MNREIKFRGVLLKHHEGLKWVYGYYSYERKSGIHEIIYEDGGRSVVGESVGQFTGMYDKNGKEIYESDLLAPFGNITQKPQIENCFVVEYSNGSYNIGKESDTDYCIIGNIYENPELLN